MMFAHFTWLTCSTISPWWEVVFSLIRRTHVMHWMESLIFYQIRLPPKDASDILSVLEHGTRLSPYRFPYDFPTSHATEHFRAFPSRGVFPNNAWLVLSDNHTSEMASISQYRLPNCQFFLLHGLHGPQSTRFDRGPHRSLLAADYHCPKVFLIAICS